MRKMTEKEKELAKYLVSNKNFDKEEYIAIGLLCNSEEKATLMMEFLQNNPESDFDIIFEKAVSLNQS